MTNIWWMVPEILSTTNIWSFWSIFLPFYTPIITQKIKILKTWKNHLEILSFYTCPINDNHMMYGSWDMKCDRQIFLSFWMGFDPPNILKNQNFEKLKKTPGYIIILHMCSINQHFKKNEKNIWIYFHFTQVYQKSWSYAIYTVPEIWCMTGIIVIFHFGLFFALLPP